MSSLPKEKEIDVFCQIGLRGYLACRILMQSGFSKVRNLSGGYRLWREIENDKTGAARNPQPGNVETETQRVPEKKTKEIVVDACGLSCPGPVLAVRKAMEGAEEGDVFTIHATDPAFSGDIESFCKRTGNKLLHSDFDGKQFTVTIRKG